VIDPDILSIQRKRRQARRCVSCGISSPRTTLCGVCSATLRYCPRCERVYPREQTSQRSTKDGRTTAYCLPCGNTVRRGDGTEWTTYAARQHARVHPKLAAVMKLYRAGLTHAAIAQAVEMNAGTLRALIYQARRRGQWPAKLRRR
jgi:hypothetical protein